MHCYNITCITNYHTTSHANNQFGVSRKFVPVKISVRDKNFQESRSGSEQFFRKSGPVLKILFRVKFFVFTVSCMLQYHALRIVRSIPQLYGFADHVKSRLEQWSPWRVPYGGMDMIFTPVLVTRLVNHPWMAYETCH